MLELQCLACNRVISEEEMAEFRGDVRCPYCGFRVLKKTRSKKIAKQVISE
jgi:DNA-directed RNA polymerase subunit RPC12/RpoP